MAAGKYAEAIPIYKRLVQSVPGNAGLLLNLALAQHMDGRERDAIPNLEAVLKVQPKNVDVRGILASALNQCAQFEEGAAQYRQLTEMSPDDPKAWYGLGKTYEAIATSAFGNLEKNNPRSPYLAALIGDTRVQRRQYGSAFIFYRQALAELPDLHGIHAALAEIYRKTGHQDWAAVEDAEERKLPPTDCKVHAAECQFAGGHDVQAATLPRTGARSPELFYWQAKASNELAFQAFFQLGQLPASVESHRLQAEIAGNQNRHLEAVKEWRAALELSRGDLSAGSRPNDARLRQELAISLFLAQDYRAAIDEAVALLKVNPKVAELNFVAGDSFLRIEEPEKAVVYLRAALTIDRGLAAANASLGLALSRLGKNAEAIPYLVKSLDLDDNGDLHYQLARAYQAAGDGEKARAAMEQYQEILIKTKEQKDEVARDAQIGPPK
jgi:tetratricopeptide (TPR) repeat protein